MNRQDRDQYEQNNYGMYEGYNPQDEHYHSARNLTNEFEQEYQRGRGHWDGDRDLYHPQRSYHEGNSMGDAYERRSRESGSVRSNTSYDMIDQDRYRNYSDKYDRDRDRYSNYQDDYRSYLGMDSGNYRGRDQEMRSNVSQGNIRQGYGISDFEGTSDRYNTLNSDQNRRGAGDNESYYSGSRGSGYGSSRFGSGMGESFPSSHHGVPDTSYGMRNFSDNYGTGMGSSYGGQNYGGGTGYSGGHRGGSFGNSTYGTSSGNYGGSGSMGGGTYGGRGSSGSGDTSHNTNRGTTEFGGF